MRETTEKIKRQSVVKAMQGPFDKLDQISNRDLIQRRLYGDAFRNSGDTASTLDKDILRPPLPFHRLEDLVDESAALSRNIQSMVLNIGGQKWDLLPAEDFPEDTPDDVWQAIMSEKRRLLGFFKSLWVGGSPEELFEMLVSHLMYFAVAYWEVIRNPKGMIIGVKPIEDPKMMRLCRKDAEPQIMRYRTRIGTEYEDTLVEYHFRRFARIDKQGRPAEYFREFGDVRNLDKTTGKYGGNDMPVAKRAREILYFRIPHPSTEYGIPIWASVFLDAQIVRVAKLCNFDVLDNSAVPPLAVVISGSTDDTLQKKLEDQIRNLRGRDSRSKILFLQVPPEEAGLGGSEEVLAPKVTFEDLSKLMTQEGMFLDVIKSSEQEINRIFRLPPILTGDLEETPNKSTAEEAKAIADEQVFDPWRRKLSARINTLLKSNVIPDRAEAGAMYWDFALRGISSDQSDRILSILKEGKAQGAVTPGQAQAVIQELLSDYKLQPFDHPLNDVPIEFQGASMGATDDAEPGTVRKLSGAQIDMAKAEISRALGKQVVNIFEYTPSLDDSDPYQD